MNDNENDNDSPARGGGHTNHPPYQPPQPPPPYFPDIKNWNRNGAVGIPVRFSHSILHLNQGLRVTMRQGWRQNVQTADGRRDGYMLQMYFDLPQVKALFPGVQRPQDLEVALVAVHECVDFGVIQGGQNTWRIVGPEGIPAPCHSDLLFRLHLFPRPEVTSPFMHFELLLQFRGDHNYRVRMDRRLRFKHDRQSGNDAPFFLPLDPSTL